jgi:RNA-directed DNA polymerase
VYFDKHDVKNRAPGKPMPTFLGILRGKVQYVGSVRGWDDSIYNKFATRLGTLDSSFRARAKPLDVDITLCIFTEGRTDRLHMQWALERFQCKGKFLNLKLDFGEDKDRGSGDLIKLCQHLSQKQQFPPCICIFDSDEPSIVRQALDTAGEVKDWSNGVYSAVIPTPTHRLNEEKVCIELLFTDHDLTRTTHEGRRLYLRKEFDPNSGRHRALECYRVNPGKSSLVVEEGVFDFASNQLALSKMQFANCVRRAVPPPDETGFAPLFKVLEDIRNRFARTRP